MSGLTLRGVTKSFGKVDVIRGVDLDIEDGEFAVFVGPSGCGKSTLLRMIAGLEDLSGGTLQIGERVVNDVPPSRRGVAMVFQSYALYPHLTVRDNIAFGLKVRKETKAEIAAKVADAATTLQLDQLLDRFPRELSGDQRQRVAIGRAIVGAPEVFLFDEPLSNLDAELRVQMRAEIAALHQRLKNTMIYVTHDQIEAMTLADRIVVLRAGRVEQVGSPRDLYARPANKFVAQFIGSPKMNILPAGLLPAGLPSPAAAVAFGIRPEHLAFARGDADWPRLAGKIRLVEYVGSGSLVHVVMDGGGEILAECAGQDAPGQGRSVLLTFASEALHFFDSQDRAIR